MHELVPYHKACVCVCDVCVSVYCDVCTLFVYLRARVLCVCELICVWCIFAVFVTKMTLLICRAMAYSFW